MNIIQTIYCNYQTICELLACTIITIKLKHDYLIDIICNISKFLGINYFFSTEIPGRYTRQCVSKRLHAALLKQRCPLRTVQMNLAMKALSPVFAGTKRRSSLLGQADVYQI